MKFIDLFGGIGGFSLGLERCGHECVGYYEVDKYAIGIYNRNFKTEYKPTDITKLDARDVPGHGILCAGFPCQPFSIAGKRQGFRDIRGTLFAEIVRIAEEKRPGLLLLENVKGLLNHDGGETFGTILHSLHELGYALEWEVLNSKNFGVPQNRERVFIVGHFGEGCPEAVFPLGQDGEATDGKIPADELEQVAQCQSSRQYANWNGNFVKIPDYAIPILTPGRPENRQKGRRFKENGEPMFTLTGQDQHGVIVANCLTPDAYLCSGARKRDDRGKAVLTSMCERRIRRLTPVECERLQGFPDGWTEGVSDAQRYKCLGNAVTVNVIEAIGRRINEVYG